MLRKFYRTASLLKTKTSYNKLVDQANYEIAQLEKGMLSRAERIKQIDKLRIEAHNENVKLIKEVEALKDKYIQKRGPKGKFQKRKK